MSEEKDTKEVVTPKVITELTPEQEALLPVYRDKHLDMFFKYNPVPVEFAKKFINEVYEFCGLDKPKEIFVVQTPKQAQELANALCGETNPDDFKYYDFSSYVNAWDLGWLSYYNYVDEVLGIELGDSYKWYYNGLTKSRIYDTIQFDEACIIIELPSVIKKKGERLHCEDGPAVSFGDGSDVIPRLSKSIFAKEIEATFSDSKMKDSLNMSYAQYYWENVAVPKKLIEETDNITKEDIQEYEGNAEIRRAFREVLGGVKYYDLLSNGDGVTLIDEDTDEQGNTMKLYTTKLADSVINKKVQFIEVICPSTDRMYNIYPPNQDSKNVWDAKASTFDNEKGRYRHGDVMLKKVDEDFDRPEQET